MSQNLRPKSVKIKNTLLKEILDQNGHFYSIFEAFPAAFYDDNDFEINYFGDYKKMMFLPEKSSKKSKSFLPFRAILSKIDIFEEIFGEIKAVISFFSVSWKNDAILTMILFSNHIRH